MDPRENISRAISKLQAEAETIRRIEKEAHEALFSRDDPAANREKLQEKARLLMELPELMEPLLKAMPKDARKEFEKGLNSFAMRAGQALELSSIFYMRALLYPDDYKEGDPNDLEVFIGRLRSSYIP